jgi:peptidoglycan/xylan/chitin deacetylase (PgdA/CDA1 family)
MIERPIYVRAAEHALALGSRLLPASRFRGKLLMLTYHDILPPGERPTAYNALRLPAERFAEQLDFLRNSIKVIGLAEALAPGDTSDRDPAVVITFDDAYIGAVRHGVAALAERGLPATIFIAPAFTDGRRFWWDMLADAAGGNVAADVRRHALEQLRGRGDEVQRWASAERIPLIEPLEDCRCATEEELRVALRHPGITIGSHTWSHPNLSVLDADTIREELERSLAWNRRFGDRALPYLAYPYGLSSATSRHVAAEAGFLGGLDLGGGWFSPASTDSFSIPRRNIPSGLSVAGFAIRLAGLARN